MYRYILEPYKGSNSRYDCPNCANKKTFVRYIETETGKHIAANVGKCNRESNCSYHYTPKQYFSDNNLSIEGLKRAPKEQLIKPQSTPISYIPNELFKRSLGRYEENNLITYLIGLFGLDTTFDLIQSYYIGTSKHWNGATVFWQIDTENKIRTGKIMLYDSNNGKRIKSPYPFITWVHTVLKKKEYNLQQCFFGEHLIGREPEKTVAIVESEKTAIISSVYLPQFIWIAVGGLNHLTAERCEVLRGRKAILFPDLNAFDKWQVKANELSDIATFKVSDLLENSASEAEKRQGLDLADYLIRIKK
jgi:hypothetical protein